MKKQFDRFTLTDQIATGPGGTLFDGDEKLPGGITRPVRVKVLPALSKADPHGESRFVDEVRILAALASHPHVVTFYGMGLTDGTPWIAMERPLATLEQVQAAGPTPSADVLRLIEHVARGLAALHALQPLRLHNRLSPASILAFDGNRHFKVSEFGLAAPPTAEPMLSADSVRYAAPELLSPEIGKPGPSTDLYALGHIAYELALGGKLHREQFPAVATTGDLRAVSPAKWQAWHHSMSTAAPPAHEVVRGFPERLGQIIARLMAKPVQARYGTAAELLADLSGAADVTAAPPVVAPPMAAPAGVPSAFAAPRGVAPPLQAASRPSYAAPARPAATTTAAPPVAMQVATGNERYFIRLRNQTSGPFDVATLQRMSRQGQFSRLHQVSTDQQTWKPAASVEGLFG